MSQTNVFMPRHRRAATVQEDSFSDDDNTISVVWTTGADVLRSDCLEDGGYYVERLGTAPENVRLDRLNKGAPFLDTHNDSCTNDVLGVVVKGSARMVDGKGVAKIRLSTNPSKAATVADIKAGILPNVSMGYAVYQFERTEFSNGDPAIMLAVDWEPYEISAVPIPADPDAQIEMRARSASGVEINSCTIIRSLPNDTFSQIDNKESLVADDDKQTEIEDDKKKDVRSEDTSDSVEDKKKDTKKEDDAEVSKDERSMPRGEDLTRMMERVANEAFERGCAEECVRQSDIMMHARKHCLEELGAEHCRLRTKVQAFKDVLLDKLAETSARSAPSVNAIRDGSAEPKDDFSFARKFYKKKD